MPSDPRSTTTRQKSTNGKPPINPLAYLRTPENLHRRATCNSSCTHLDMSAMADVALTMLVELVENMRSRTPIQAVDLDELDSTALSVAVNRRIQGIPELAELAASDLEGRQRLLRDVAAAKSTRVWRQMREIAEEVIDEPVTRIRRELDKAVLSAPFKTAKIADDIKRGLAAIVYGDANQDALRQFTNNKRSIDALDSSAGRGLGPIVKLLEKGLRESIAQAFDESIEAIAQGITNEIVRAKVDELLPLLEEHQADCTQLRTHLEEVTKILDRRCTAACHSGAVRSDSVDVVLSGPGKDELLATMKDRLKCADRRELVERYAEKLETALNQIAERRSLIETPAKLVVLLRRLEPEIVADAIDMLARECLGEAHTVYASIRRDGVPMIAKQLFQLADVLVSFACRDHAHLMVEPRNDTIVRLPEPRGPDDQQIKEDLLGELTALSANNLTVQPAGLQEQEITVTRTVIGWPVGVLEDNDRLLVAYEQSAEDGHRPHLFGLLPGSELGQQDAATMSLAKHLKKKGTQL
jgi:hypothetical protein